MDVPAPLGSHLLHVVSHVRYPRAASCSDSVAIAENHRIHKVIG
jgi:hypothetical protein